MLRIVIRGQQLQEALNIRHNGGRLLSQQFAIDNVQLLGRIVGQPVLQMLCIFAGIQATVAQVLERFRGGIASGDYLIEMAAQLVELRMGDVVFSL